MRRCRLQRTVVAWILLPYLRFVFSPCGRFRTFLFLFLFPLSPSFGLEVQVKGIAGFEGFHGGSLPEMKSAVVLISPSPAAPAVRFIRSKEYAREKDESCYELAAPPLRRTTLHRAFGPLHPFCHAEHCRGLRSPTSKGSHTVVDRRRLPGSKGIGDEGVTIAWLC